MDETAIKGQATRFDEMKSDVDLSGHLRTRSQSLC